MIMERDIHTYKPRQQHIYVCLHTYTDTHMHTYTHKKHVEIMHVMERYDGGFACVCVCVYIYIYIYIYIYRTSIETKNRLRNSKFYCVKNQQYKNHKFIEALLHASKYKSKPHSHSQTHAQTYRVRKSETPNYN